MTFYADSLAFLNLPMQPPIAVPELPQHLNLAICTAAIPVGLNFGQTLESVHDFRLCIEKQDHLQLILSQGDLRYLSRVSGVTGVVLSLQNMPTPDNGIANGLKQFYDAGVRVLTPCYEDTNNFGGGFLTPQQPLTEEGWHLIEQSAQLGMIIDLSHVGLMSAQSVLHFGELRHNSDCKPKLMASHGGIADIFAGTTDPARPRNLPLDLLKRLVAVGGLVGIYTLTFGLDESHDGIGPFLWHLSKAVRELGSANVCIGSDAVYHEVDTGAQAVQFEKMRAKLDPTGVKGSRSPDTMPQFNTVERMPRIKTSLVAAHLGPAEVREDILGESLRRWLLANLPE
ncbi:membrane dipeptidase [Candidatus Saccharibacteria bacterium]|nr:membrane dipeptidase [Candidatus Saccharibacteria bacterium]